MKSIQKTLWVKFLTDSRADLEGIGVTGPPPHPGKFITPNLHSKITKNRLLVYSVLEEMLHNLYCKVYINYGIIIIIVTSSLLIYIYMYKGTKKST